MSWYYNNHYNRYKSSNSKPYQQNRSIKQQPSYLQRNYEDDFNYNNSKICGITNLGNNCYLSSGLQILASCEELVKVIKNNEINGYNIVNELKNAFNTLLSSSKTYYPENFIKCFCSKNVDFIRGSQCCSQDFIRTLIRNINDIYLSCGKEKIFENKEYKPLYEEKAQYNKFINSNKIFPESNVMSIFSGINKSYSFGKCPKCRYEINDYSFNYFIDQNIYLDEFHKESKFSEVLNANLGNYNTLTMDCPSCNREIQIKEENKIVKLPKILIFTLERYQGPTNSVRIIPDDFIYMDKYIDKSLKMDEQLYELFAVNIRIGRNINFGHEICQVKRGDKWYEINDSYGNIISNPSHFDCSYGLFYRKIESGSEKTKKNEYESSEQFSHPNKSLYQELSIISKNNENIKSVDNNKGHENINCAFEIMASFKELIEYLDNNNNLPKISSEVKNKIKYILNNENPDLTHLKNYFFKINTPQDYIRSLIIAMNEEFLDKKYSNRLIEKNKDYNVDKIHNLEYHEYNNFIKTNKIYPQSEIYSIFNVMTKQKIYGKCQKCKKILDKYLFENQIDFILKLPEGDCNFLKLLEQIFNSGKKQMQCDICKVSNNCSKKTTIIKLPDILIFTLNRADNGKINKVKINPDKEIPISDYIDCNLKAKHTKYKLFAILMKNNTDLKYICKVNRKGNLAKIFNDQNDTSYLDSSYGLFYRRSKHS